MGLPPGAGPHSVSLFQVVRFLVFTSIILTTATAAAGAQPDVLCQLDDGAPDTASSAVDQDGDRRPGSVPMVALPALAPAFEPVVTATAECDSAEPTGALPTAAVLDFAPKTSPPRARWF